MTRLLAVLVLSFSSSAFAAAPPTATAPATPQQSPAAQPAPETAATPVQADRDQLKREVMDEVHKALEKQKQEVRDELRTQATTQSANRSSLEEEFQLHEEKKKLQLFELSGYYRVRPELFYQLDLRRGTDSDGRTLFPLPASNPNRKTLADANMRWRLEPTLNVSEDIRLHSQIDIFDNLLFGTTPQGGFGISQRTQWTVLSETQNTPLAGQNWLQNSIAVRRAYGEVNTPVGQFLFGRMGSQWGLGMLANSGNCIDCDYGTTVDRFMFVTQLAGYYIVPMLDFVVSGPSNARQAELQGQPIDIDQLDDGHDYSIIIAKRDTDLELSRKLQAGQDVLNYGVYFTYRHQASDAASFYSQTNNPYGGQPTNFGFVSRDASIYIPDIWAKYQTRKLRLELEAAAILGKIGNAAPAPGSDSQSILLRQFGAVGQGEYKITDSINVNLELGFASGDKAPGMGNLPGRGVTKAGSIDGQQWCLSAAECPGGKIDNSVTNFRFNRDYRVDLILWREIFDGITDAVYIRPGVKYEITEGLGLWANIIYSRAVFGASTPSSHTDPSDTSGKITGDANLGLEIDGGLRYDSGDGFLAGVSYGVLFPFAGLNNNLPNLTSSSSTAQTVRGWFVIKY